MDECSFFTCVMGIAECNMTPGLTHEQCRREMCAACGGRAGTRRLTPALGERLRKWAQPAWSPDVTSYPTGVCDTCLRLLCFCENEKSNDLLDRPGAKQRWIDFKLENVKVCRGKLVSNCTCPICQARKSNFVGRISENFTRKISLGKFHSENFTRKISL